tara:strand:- start:437 stop:841 length:405 start_codon:yes stop_codon:yes gene_type:complete
MIDKNRRVSVYFNLHKKIWSVRQSGSPVEHHTEVCLKDVRYLVQPAGRAKVLKERRKNVHAFLTGYMVDRVPVPLISFDVTYNPYKHETFVSADDHDPQEWSEYAHLSCGEGWKYVEAIFTREYFNSDLLQVPA